MEHQVLPVASLFLHIIGGVDEHSPRSQGGVTDAHALARLQQFHDETHHRARRVELAALLPGIVGKTVDQVLVGVSQDVAGSALVRT